MTNRRSFFTTIAAAITGSVVASKAKADPLQGISGSVTKLRLIKASGVRLPLPYKTGTMGEVAKIGQAINIQAMDASWFRANAEGIADAIHKAIRDGKCSQLTETIRNEMWSLASHD